MAKRRGHGEGSIYLRPDGRWCAYVTVGQVKGKQKRKYIYGKTRKEVAEKLKAALRDQQLGLNITPERLTVESFLTTWLEEVVRRRLRPRPLQRQRLRRRRRRRRDRRSPGRRS